MAIVYRAIKGSRLTVTEIDGNFEELSDLVNTKVDSADVRTLVDSAYVQARQLTFDFLDSGEVIALIDSAYVQARQADIYRDSGFVTSIVDSAYVQSLQVDLQRDSSFITNIADSDYVRARQDYSYSELVGAPTTVSSFTNDANYLDSNTATNLVDSAYIQARQLTFDFMDSAEVISLIDSAYIRARQIDIDTHTTTDLAEGNNLYYTQARFDSAFNDKTTTDLTEGIQRYYTSARADSDAKRALTGGTGVTYVPATGTISIGQEVGTSDSVTFQAIQVDNLTVSGTQTTVNTQTLNVVDPMIKMADDNIVDINDIGFFGQYGDGTTTRHTGLFRDASDKEYYLFSQLVDSPTTFVNRSGVDFELSTLNVGTINASNVLDSGHVGRMIQSLSTDSAAVFLLVDSAYIQTRQITYDVPNLLSINGNKIDLDYDEVTGRSNNISISSLQSAYIFLDNNNSETGNYFGIYNDLDPTTDAVTENDAVFKVDEDGKVYSNTLNVNQSQGTAKEILKSTMGSNDYFRIMSDDNGVDAGYVEIATADNGTEPIYVRQYSGNFSSVTRTLTLLDGSGNTTMPGSLRTYGNILPGADSTYDLGSSTEKWRDLYLSGNTIYLGDERISADNSTLKVNGKSLFNYSSPDDALISISDKFIETSTELTDAQAPTDPQVVFNTWSKFSHQGANQPAASTGDLNAWSYNSGTGAVENSLNTGSATGFYSPRKYDSYTHEATLKSSGSDDDILGVIIGYVIEDGKHYTLSAVRQTTGNIISAGLQWGLVYNINQDHTDNTRDQALLANGTSTAGGASQGWSSFANGTKVRVRKIGSSLSIKTSQWNSTSIDDTTEITFDLSSDSRTQRFVGSVPYGYVAWSQGPASFSGLSFTPDTPESIIHFKDNGATQFYQYNSGTSNWDLDTSSTLGEKKGKFYHNDKTGRTFFNDGDNVVPIGTVRQFNDVIYQVPQAAAPTATTIGALGLKPGMFAVADGTNWDPASKGGSVPYPVFWDGSTWNALY